MAAGKATCLTQIIKPLSIDDIMAQLRAGKRVVNIRYGDGEWKAILDVGDKRAGEQTLKAPLIQDGVRDSLQLLQPQNDLYLELVAMDVAERLGMASRIAHWISIYAQQTVGRWYGWGWLEEAALAGKLQPFIAWLQTKRVGFVGPVHLRRGLAQNEILDLDAYVQTSADCFTDWLYLYQKIKDTCNNVDVLLFSAGPTAKVLISQLYREGWRPTVSMIDTGSVWEPLCGRVTRSYHVPVILNREVNLGL